MTDKLADFMVELATNDSLKKQYLENPEALMEKYGVAEEDIKLLINHEYGLIMKRLGTNYSISSNTHITAYKKNT